jgi:hypothetical protein
MERDIEILTHKIDECNQLIANCEYFGISQRKIEKLKVKRDRYQTQLDAILN